MATKISKFTVRFKVDEGGSPEQTSLDTKINSFLRDLSDVGGYQEWIRGAIRKKYIEELKAQGKPLGGEETW